MFAIVIRCPTHPAYTGRIAPDYDDAAGAGACRLCKLVFAVRNETNKVLSIPTDERDEPRELVIHTIQELKCTR